MLLSIRLLNVCCHVFFCTGSPLCLPACAHDTSSVADRQFCRQHFFCCLCVSDCSQPPSHRTYVVRQSLHNAGVSGIQNRAVMSKLHFRSSEEDASKNPTVKVASTSSNRASPGANGASPGSSRAGEEKPATMTITLSADSAQRLKAQAAESGLHQSDSGLASKLVLGCKISQRIAF